MKYMKKRTPTICPVVFSLDILGDKWSLVVLRDILLRNKSHFREFLTSEERIASNILSTRLESLVSEGLLIKKVDPLNKSAAIYIPTQKMLDLLPMLLELMRWGIKYNPDTNPSSPIINQLINDPESLRSHVIRTFRTPTLPSSN
jgi:DNA-binding HxlR family transcriptional regulator